MRIKIWGKGAESKRVHLTMFGTYVSQLDFMVNETLML